MFGALAIANGQVVEREVEVFDPQSDALRDAQPAAVEKLADQAVDASEAGEQFMGFLPAEDDGDVFGAFGAHGVDGEVERLFEHAAVEEEDGVEGLVLGGGGDLFLGGEVSEEVFDFGLAHVDRVAFAVEGDEAPDPIHVLSFGLVGVVFAAQDGAGVGEQFTEW